MQLADARVWIRIYKVPIQFVISTSTVLRTLSLDSLTHAPLIEHLRTMGICASTSNVEQPSVQKNPIASSRASTTKSNRALEKKVSEILTKAKKRREVIQDAAANISPDYKAPSFAKPECQEHVEKSFVWPA